MHRGIFLAFLLLAPGASMAAERQGPWGPEGGWWRLYQNPALDGLVERALTANTDLRAAEANLRGARAYLGEARAARWPSTTVEGSALHGDATAPGARDRRWSFSRGLSLSWELDLLGRLSSATAAAGADAEAVAALRDEVRVTVIAGTVRAYVDACAFGAAEDQAKASLTIAERSRALVQAQEGAGVASRLDVEQASAAAATARAAVPDLQARRRSALLALAALVGETPSTVPEDAVACRRPPTAAMRLPLAEDASRLGRRPDVRQAERRLAADAARIGVATADLYPRISLGASAIRRDGEGAVAGTTLSAGPLLSWSFPNMAVARARLRQAQAREDASLAQFDGAVLAALKDIEQALARYAGETDRNLALSDAVDRADRAHQLADRRYRAGDISALELLIVERTLITARMDLALSDQQLGTARVDLFEAQGDVERDDGGRSTMSRLEE